jgi:hypothetical protein
LLEPADIRSNFFTPSSPHLPFQDYVRHSQFGGVGDGERDQLHAELFGDVGGFAMQFKGGAAWRAKPTA